MLPKIQNILYATDLSENSRLAFEFAMSLAEQYKSQIVVLHVIEPVNPNTYSQIGGIMGESDWLRFQADYEDGIVDQLGAKLRQFCLDMQHCTPEGMIGDDQVLIRKGTPVHEILSASTERKADLIVMGTHGYGMVKDALMGGTARRVIRRSELPVLVVPSREGRRSD